MSIAGIPDISLQFSAYQDVSSNQKLTTWLYLWVRIPEVAQVYHVDHSTQHHRTPIGVVDRASSTAGMHRLVCIGPGACACPGAKPLHDFASAR
jgi:hypothetical protein